MGIVDYNLPAVAGIICLLICNNWHSSDVLVKVDIRMEITLGYWCYSGSVGVGRHIVPRDGDIGYFTLKPGALQCE